MKKETLQKIEELIEDRIQTLEAELEEANGKIEQLERDQAWTAHKQWSAKHLPVPRIEMHLVCYGRAAFDHDDNRSIDEVVCTQYLVYQHFLDHYEAVPLGRTSSRSSFRDIDDAIRRKGRDGEPELYLPFRDSAHARSNARRLNLPLFVVHEDEAWQVDVETFKQTRVK